MGGQFGGRGSMNKTGTGGSHDGIMFVGKLKGGSGSCVRTGER